jgi:GDP-L-fucose synthase
MSFWERQRVLVSGGTGFLGHHVIEKLKKMGANNVFTVSHSEYDLSREEEVGRLFAEHRADTVIHLAGLVGGILPNKERPAEYFYSNLMMGTLMLHYAWKSGVQRFIAAGAGCGYPEFASNPLKETDFWAGFPQKESAPYSLAKRLLSIQAEAYNRQYGFSTIIAIPGNIYGPHDNYNLLDAHVVPALVRKFIEAVETGADEVIVWGDGKAARDFIYAGDVADGMLLAAEKINGCELINMSSGKETSILDIVTTLKEISGFKGRLTWDTSKPNGQLHRRFDISKAKELLNWSPATSLHDGLKLTLEWYQTHQETARK